MMKVALVGAMKGGCGKSTFATNLAGTLPGITAILDLDAQGTAHDWTTFRDKRGISPSVYAVKSTANDLKGYLDKARKNNVDWCVIDTTPASDSALLMAAKYADVIVIPTLVNIADVRAVKTTIRLLKGFNVPQFVVLNCVRTIFGFPKRRKTAVDAITSFGGCVPEVFFPSSVEFPDAQVAGQTVAEYRPNGVAAQQVHALGNLLLSSVWRHANA